MTRVEQFEGQQRDARNKMISLEERTVVRDLILLPYIDTIVSKSLKEIEHSGNILKRAYSIAGQAIPRRIRHDTHQLRKQQSIRVLADE